jgi:muconolactone delta-isomerase
MPNYEHYATMTTDLVYRFTAKDDDEARQIVENSGGEEYVECGGDWDNGSLYRLDKKGISDTEVTLK